MNRAMEMRPNSVTVIIPTIPARHRRLGKAVESVEAQTYWGLSLEVAGFLEVVGDPEGLGSSVARNSAIFDADTEWCAFLDDDDEFYPHHLETLIREATEHGADVAYPRYDYVVNGVVNNRMDPLVLPEKFDPEELRVRNYIPVTALVRTGLLREVGGFVHTNSEEWPHPDCEDWGTWLRLLDAGARFHHVPERTWRWHLHPNNTSGQPERARKLYG